MYGIRTSENSARIVSVLWSNSRRTACDHPLSYTCWWTKMLGRVPQLLRRYPSGIQWSVENSSSGSTKFDLLRLPCESVDTVAVASRTIATNVWSAAHGRLLSTNLS